MTAVVLSPHLDDAVLSCTGRLLDGDVQVVTVCAGVPPAGASLSSWDEVGGARSARERALERLAEDDAALGRLGVPTVRLDELGQHYRGAPYDVAAVAARLEPLFASAVEVWLPAGIGGHGAHVGTSRAGLAAARAVGVEHVVLYADLPYAIDLGWPASTAGVEAELRRLGHDPAALVAITRTLEAEEQQRKQAAVRCYRTQLTQLGVDADGHFSDAAADRLELAFRLPPAA